MSSIIKVAARAFRDNMAHYLDEVRGGKIVIIQRSAQYWDFKKDRPVEEYKVEKHEPPKQKA